ncbi:MAG: glutamine-hydrolyzing carbamoyl-phosphate synthase small subunit [Thermoplasmataceae archaeon]|jgi:carbamoyl-phosphate synthase small subunit
MSRWLILEDGTSFQGVPFGSESACSGEIVFTTSMTGYVETITDPSYRGQIVVFASPTIGNYPLRKGKMQSQSPHVSGIVTRDAHAIMRSDPEWIDFHNLLSKHGIPGIDGIDTRMIVKKIRENGVMKATIKDDPEVSVKWEDPMQRNLVSEVSPPSEKFIQGNGKDTFLFIDLGAKVSLTENMLKLGSIYSVRYDFNPDSVRVNYDAIFLSNGPGDPSHESLKPLVKFVSENIGKIPVFGVCLGHQIIGLASGAATEKMKYGHRGVNHAVTDGSSIMVTSHNHGYAINRSSLDNTDLRLVQWDINDGTVERIESSYHKIMSVQYHPEASPGPSDGSVFFREIKRLMEVKNACK